VTHVAGYPDDIAFVIYAYTLVYLMDTLGEILIAVFQAFERMEYEAASQIVRDLINISLSLLAIYLRQSLLTIVFISVIAQVCKLLFMMALVYGRFVRPRLAISFRTSKTLLISSLPFGVLLILYTVQAQFGTFILSLHHTADTVGIYSAAYSLFFMLMILPSAFSAAIFPAFSKYSMRRFVAELTWSAEVPEDQPQAESRSRPRSAHQAANGC
jgi:O-antigen/teichoic acid export membrane protein